jgi:hypothetical protein
MLLGMNQPLARINQFFPEINPTWLLLLMLKMLALTRIQNVACLLR